MSNSHLAKRNVDFNLQRKTMNSTIKNTHSNGAPSNQSEPVDVKDVLARCQAMLESFRQPSAANVVNAADAADAAVQDQIDTLCSDIQRLRNAPAASLWMASLAPAERDNHRNSSELHDVGFASKHKAEEFAEYQMDFFGRKYAVAEVFTAPPPALTLPQGWFIAETGGGELVVRGPHDGPGAMTIPKDCQGSLPVRLLDALGRVFLAGQKHELHDLQDVQGSPDAASNKRALLKP